MCEYKEFQGVRVNADSRCASTWSLKVCEYILIQGMRVNTISMCESICGVKGV